MTAVQREEFDNLLLLCGTCHKLVDAKPNEYSANWLQEVKRKHEIQTPRPLDLSQADAHNAMLLLAKHLAKAKRATQVTRQFTGT